MYERDLIDLNLGIHSNDFCALSRKETSDEFRQNDLLSIDGFPSHLRVSQMRRALQRKLQTQDLFVLGSVSVYGFCSTDLSRELERYRSLFAVGCRQTLPSGHSQWSLSQQPCPRQSSSGLAYLCGLCPSVDSRGQTTLSKREARRG